MRILAILTAALILTGCASGANDSALATVLDPLMTNHAASLGSDDVSDIRRTGRILIATFDAAALRQ
jgi:PBP1b-binding outer membrane lipoprotein LpoB